MDLLLGMGVFGTIIGIFWVIAGFCIPFFIWGMHTKTHQMAKDLAQIKNAIITVTDRAKTKAKQADEVRDIG